MRLTCPNCGAQYEVPDEVIPTGGRDVQCSSCGNTWFQHHPSMIPAEDLVEPDNELIEEPTPSLPPVEEVAAQAGLPPEKPHRKRELDPSVTDVLREEAAREAQARQHDEATLEEQPDLGLAPPDDEVTRRQREAQDRMVRMRGGEHAASAAVAATKGAGSSRRDVLPDIDEINSTLRKDSARRGPATTPDPRDETRPQVKKRSSFRRGFMFVLLLAVIAFALYVFAPQLAETVPALKPYLDQYVAYVDNARIWLDETVRGFLSKLDTLAAEAQQATPEDQTTATPSE